MRILIEEYPYQAAAVKDVLEGIDALQNVEGQVSLSYVGYFYNPTLDDCVFILPKVLLKPGINGEKDRVFGKYAPEDVMHIDEAHFENTEEREFIYKFSVWIYRAITVYNQSTPHNNIVYKKKVVTASKGRKHKSETFLDILLSLLEFNRKNQNFFFFILKNLHAGYNKINWGRTISTTDAIVQDAAPVYLRPVNKKRQVNFDEELIIIFFSILNYIGDTYGFAKHIPVHYELIRDKQFDAYLKGMGKRRLLQIKYKYFSDKALELWELCYAFFDNAKKINVDASQREYLLVKNFNIVFEAIIDALIGDVDAPKDLKEQLDGKRVDHIYIEEGLITHEEQQPTYYIGDSKYYKMGNRLGAESVYKQYTYARNVIQWNLDFFLSEDEDKKAQSWGGVKQLRDDVTEGYNIIPNFFISATLDENLKYDQDKLRLSEDKQTEFHSQQFRNRLFDRDTLLLSHYDVNFLYVVSLYARDKQHEQQVWKQKVREKFREQVQTLLQTRYKFYAMAAHENVNAEEYFKMHFKEILGKVYTPFPEKNVYSLALDKAPEFSEENKSTLSQLRQYFYIEEIGLGENPKPYIEKAIANGIGSAVPPMETDMVLCIMFDNVHEIVNRNFSQIAQGLSLTESALRLTSDLSNTKYILLHNKREWYLFRTSAAPRLASTADINKAETILKLKSADLYLVFDIDSTPITDAPINASRLANAKGDDRISYYSTLVPYEKLL